MIRIWPDTLAGRTIALLVGTTLALMIGSLWLLYDERHEQFDNRDQFQLVKRIDTLVQLLNEVEGEERQRILKTLRQPGEKLSLDQYPEVFGPPRHPLEHMLSRKISHALKETDPKRVNVKIEVEREQENDHEYERPRRPHLEAIRIAIQLQDQGWLNITTENFKGPPPLPLRTLLWLLLLLIMLSLSGFWIARRMAKPMTQLAQAAERFGTGQEQSQLSETGPREVRHTIRAFNRMQQRIKKQIKDRSLMLAAVSHDLKTPITVLRLRAEYIEDREMKDKTLATLAEMEAILTATLNFSRDEAADEQSRDTDLAALIQSLVDDHTDLGEKVEYNGPERLIIQCRPVSLKRAINNIVVNAIRYADGCSIALNKATDSVQILIQDQGPGIPEDKLQQVLTPFYRLEQSRNRDTGGVGLGLAVANSIVLAHGGEMALSNREAGGLAVEISLPFKSS